MPIPDWCAPLAFPQDSRFDLFEIYPTESPSVNALLFLELSLEQTVTKLSTKMMAR